MKIDPDDHHFFGDLPSSHLRVIKELEETDTEVAFLERIADIRAWSEFDNEQTDLKAWVNILNRIDSIFELYIKYNSSRIILVPFAQSDSSYADTLAKSFKENEASIVGNRNLLAGPEVMDIVEILLRFLKLLIGNARSREVFNSVDYIREFYGCESEVIEFLALEVLFQLVKIPESHVHVEERDEEIETTAQVDLGLSKLLLCFAQGYGSKSQGLDLRSLLTKDSDLLPEFPGRIVYDFYRTDEAIIKQEVRDVLDEVFPIKRLSKRNKLPEKGLVRITISKNDLLKSSVKDLFRKVVRKYQLPRKNYFSFLQRLRMARAFLSREGRIRRTRMRLISLAILFKICSTADLMPAYITHEPELTAEIVDLITGVSVEDLRNAKFDDIPFDIKLTAMRVLQRLPASSFELSGTSASLSPVGKNSNVLQHLGVMKGQANGLLSNYVRSLCLDLDKYFPLECPEKRLAFEETRPQNTFFKNPEDELCFAFGLTFASAACDSEYDEVSMEYARKVFKARDDIEARKLLNERLRTSDELFAFYENILLLCGEVTGTQQGAILLATTGILNNYSLVIHKELEERRRINDAYIDDTSTHRFHLNSKRTQLLSQIVFTLSALIAISSFALSLAHELEISSFILSYIEEIVLKAISENIPRKNERKSRKSKTKKSRAKKRKSPGVVESKLTSSILLKEPSRLKPFAAKSYLIGKNSILMSEKVLLRNLLQFLVILVQRSSEHRRPNFNIKEENSKIVLIFKMLFSYSHVFGAANFNMVSTLFTEIINFEPSSIYNIYRNDIHQIIASHIVEDKIPADPQSKCCLPNLLSALCLHSEGEKFIQSKQAVLSLVDQLFKPELLYNCSQIKQNLESNECEEIYEMCANNLDHFLRNHKTFRFAVSQKFLDGIELICNSSNKKDYGELTVGDFPKEDDSSKKKVQFLFGSIKLFAHLVKNKDVVEILFTISGAIDKLTHCYLLTLMKSSRYLLKNTEDRADRSASRAVTDLVSSLFFHDKFPHVIIRKLKKTLGKVFELERKINKGENSFPLLSWLPENFTFGQMKADAENRKKGKPHCDTLNDAEHWKHSALIIKSLAYVEWLVSLLLSWMGKLSKAQNFRVKVANLYSILSKNDRDANLTVVLSDLLEVSMSIVQERIYFQQKFDQEREELKKIDDMSEREAARSIRLVASIELQRFNKTVTKLATKINEVFISCNRNALQAVDLVKAYDTFVDTSMFQVNKEILERACWLSGLDALYFRAQKIGLIVSILLGENALKPHVLLAYRMFKKGILSRYVKEAASIFHDCLQLYSEIWQSFKDFEELEKFLELCEKVLFDVSNFFDCLSVLASECKLNSTILKWMLDIDEDLKTFWKQKNSFKGGFEFELDHYPYSGDAFSLQLKLLCLTHLSTLIKNESIGVLAFLCPDERVNSALNRFFGVISDFRNSFSENNNLFPESTFFELTVNVPEYETYDEFQAKYEERVKDQKNLTNDKHETEESFDFSDGISSNLDAKRLKDKDILIQKRYVIVNEFLASTRAGLMPALRYLLCVVKHFREQKYLNSMPVFHTSIDSLFYIAESFSNVIDLNEDYVGSMFVADIADDETLCKTIAFTILAQKSSFSLPTVDNLIEDRQKQLKAVVVSFSGTERSWKSCFKLCPVLLSLVCCLRSSKATVDLLGKVYVTALNLLKVMNKVQAKKNLFTLNEILALISLWTELLKCPKAKDFFIRNSGFTLLFQLRISPGKKVSHDIITRLFLEVFANSSQRAYHFKLILKACYTKTLSRSSSNKVYILSMKNVILLLYIIDRQLLVDAFTEIFHVQVQQDNVFQSDKRMFVKLLDSEISVTSMVKSNKKLDKLRSQAFVAAVVQIVRILKKDLLQEQASKRKKKETERLFSSANTLQSICFLMHNFPFDIDELLLKPVQNEEIGTVVSEIFSKCFKVEPPVFKSLSLYSVLINAVLPINFIFKKVEAPLIQNKAEVELRNETFGKVLDLLSSVADISEITGSTSVFFLIEECAKMLKALADTSGMEKKRRSSKMNGADITTTINRMWTINGFLEEIIIILSRTKLKLNKANSNKKGWFRSIKRLFDHDIVKLLLKSLNLLLPFHSKLFQCVGTILTLLDTMTKPSTLKSFTPASQNDIQSEKKVTSFIESPDNRDYHDDSDLSLMYEDLEDEQMTDNESSSDFDASIEDYDDEEISEVSEGTEDILDEATNLELIAESDSIVEEDMQDSSTEETSTQIEDDNTSHQEAIVEEEYDEVNQEESDAVSDTDASTITTTTSSMLERRQNNLMGEDLRSLNSDVISTHPIVRHLRDIGIATMPNRLQSLTSNVGQTLGRRSNIRRNNIFALLDAPESFDWDNHELRQGMQNSFQSVLHSLFEERRRNGDTPIPGNFNITFGRAGDENVSFRMNIGESARSRISELRDSMNNSSPVRRAFSMIHEDPEGVRLPGISIYFIPQPKIDTTKPKRRLEKLVLQGEHPLLQSNAINSANALWKQCLKEIKSKRKARTSKTKGGANPSEPKAKKVRYSPEQHEDVVYQTPPNYENFVRRFSSLASQQNESGNNESSDVDISNTSISAGTENALVASDNAMETENMLVEDNIQQNDPASEEVTSQNESNQNNMNIETAHTEVSQDQRQSDTYSTTQHTTTESNHVVELITGLDDITIRREVFLSLTPEQIRSLPETLQAESQLYRQNSQAPTTFVPAPTSSSLQLQLPQVNQINAFRPTRSTSTESSRTKKRKIGLPLEAEITGFEDILGEKEIESLMKLFFHLRQGKKLSHKNVLWNLCEHPLFREIILCKMFQLLEPDVEYLNFTVRKIVQRSENSFKLTFSEKKSMSETERIKAKSDKKWCPVKMIGTSETIFTRYASQLQPINGFIPFLAFRRVLEALRFICSRSKRVCLLLLERPGALEFLFEILSVKEYFSNIRFLSIMVEIIVHIVAYLNHYTPNPSLRNPNLFYPEARIINKRYFSYILSLFGSTSCSEEIFVKLKAPLRQLAVVKENCENILLLSSQEATIIGAQAISELAKASSNDPLYNRTSAELKFFRLLRVIKDVSIRNKDISKDYLKLLKIDLKGFLDAFVHSIKRYAKTSTHIFPLKKALSLSDLGLGEITPKAKRTAGSFSMPVSFLKKNMKAIEPRQRKTQVHSMALALAQTKLTMFKCFFNVCFIQEAAAESMLVEFVLRFKNVLNSLIQQNSSLLESDFKIILLHPKCKHAIDFHNKRQYFRNQVRKLKSSKRGVRVQVRRNFVYADSYNNLASKSRDEMLGKLSVQFLNEEGVDAGGVAREYYQILCRQMFDPSYCLFSASSDSSALQPDSKSQFAENHLQNFKFIGRMVAKAILEGILIDAHFTRSFYKHILGLPIDYRDIDAIDPQYYKSLCDLLVMDIEDLGLELTFTTDEKEFGVVKTVELKPNGRNIKVTDENKMEYVQLCTLHKMTTGIREQIEAFLKGFHEIVPLRLISIFNEQELELLICGVPEVDLDDLQNNTDYVGYTSDSSQVKWFWKVIKGWPKEDHARFLMFVTGTSKVPLGGFKNLVGMRGTQKFSIHKSFKNDQILPSAHTCFNQFDLPEYSSEKILKEKLSYAVKEGGEGFGFR